MDRVIDYALEQITVDDFLNQRVADMIALSKLASALLGQGTFVDGLACAPTSPASMDVVVSEGQVYSIDAVDSTTYGDLSPTADINGHSVTPATATILKQGLILSPTTFALAAPTTSGDSVDYLISVQYQDVDSLNAVLNYYNSSNPSQTLQGPDNSGTAQPTLRQGKCVLTLTEGVAATTGTQLVPATPSGGTALWVITVPYGATSITSSMIAQVSGAPFLNQKLFNLMNASGGLTTGPVNFGVDSGTANNYVVTCDPPVKALVPGLEVTFIPANPNNGASTLNLDGLGAIDLLGQAALPLQGGEVYGTPMTVVYNGTYWYIKASTGGTKQTSPATASNQAVAQSQVSPGTPFPAGSNDVTNGTTTSFTSATYTAPCDGIAVFWSFQSGSGVSASVTGTGQTASLSGLVSLLFNGSGSTSNFAVGYLPMTSGQQSTFSFTATVSASQNLFSSGFVWFIPTP